jgi:2-polyprenyl-6-hydroxyphenyl methylase/3-demethylubiquinone-9 3-methyltransferase
MADETPSPDEIPLGRRNYAQFADRYAAMTPTKAANAYHDRPAVRSLLPDVAGRDVLDAGCGPGHYAAWLARRGARVVAIDVTPEMIALARAHVAGLGVELHEADLERPLPLPDRTFDLVLCPLVLDYVRDLGPTFREFRRVARAGATLVFSMGHPMQEWAWRGESGVYYDVEPLAMRWKGFGEPSRWRCAGRASASRSRWCTPIADRWPRSSIPWSRPAGGSTTCSSPPPTPISRASTRRGTRSCRARRISSASARSQSKGDRARGSG